MNPKTLNQSLFPSSGISPCVWMVLLIKHCRILTRPSSSSTIRFWNGNQKHSVCGCFLSANLRRWKLLSFDFFLKLFIHLVFEILFPGIRKIIFLKLIYTYFFYNWSAEGNFLCKLRFCCFLLVFFTIF